ncbi:GNAT family N-acetyltransferase [Phocaeicola sp.]|uniref:GNAT family N-acetyltransferase n=1 Tax=Phocaeicola sp. TaxID=2773926 RepID=UPI0026218DFB|nr:GNAT family N-acetyltransferase [Phocaeicola sp.]
MAETTDKKIVGYILLTEVKIDSGIKSVTSLSVAPLAVLPEFQNMGIGGMLIKEAHKRAALLGYGTAVLLVIKITIRDLVIVRQSIWE